MTDRKKPGVAFWATVALVVVLLYVASFGPACWITSRNSLSGDWLFVAYRPLVWTMENGPGLALDALAWYSLVGAADNWGWEIDLDGHFFQFGLPQ